MGLNLTPQYLQPGDRPGAAWFARLLDSVAAVQPIGRCTQTTRGVVYRRRRVRVAAGLDMSVFAFGYTVSGDVVTVVAGKIRHGVRTAVVVDAAEVTISNDHTWIWVDYVYGGTASIGSGTTEPVSTETNILVPLHQWRLENERVSLEKIHYIGDIIIPAAYA